MKPGDNILVYGTLKSGHGANAYMQGRAAFIRDDRISAKMYSMGGFPGVRIIDEDFVSEGPTVFGEVYRIEDEQLPAMLDGYEGYPRLYGRRQVRTESGETAWVYEINEAPDESRLVPSGRWE